MAAVDDLDQVIEQYHLAQGELFKGNPEPMKKPWSHRQVVTLANPYGGVARGGKDVARAREHTASQFRDGKLTSVENVEKYVTAELAYVVEIERIEAKIGGREDITPFDARVRLIFRPEDGEWKVVHRHADPITTAQPAESVIQK
jgi:ketosteroid isomerase-like protein